MIQGINESILSTNSLLETIDNGILLLHKRQSGIYLMLNKSIESYYSRNELRLVSVELKVYALNEEHPVFYKLFKDYNILQLPALLIIKNGAIVDITNWPFSKSILSETLSVLKNR